MASAASAQQGLGREGRLSYGTGLNYDFDEGLSSTTNVALAFSTRTAIDTFTFGVGTDIYGDFTDGGSDDFTFRNWNADLGYSRSVANSAISFTLGYREAQLEDEVDTSGPVLVITQDGSVATTSAAARYDTGITGPFGLTLDARYLDRNYTGTTDPDLVDQTEVGLDVLARFSISPSTAIRALAGISRTEEKDALATKTETTYVGIGVATNTASGLDITADLLFDRSETTTSTPSSTVDDGIGFDLNVLQPRPDGSIGARLSSRVDDSGRRTTARVLRSFNTPTGALAFSIGVVDQEGESELHLVGDLNYTMATASGGDFTASVARDAGTSDGQTVISTSLQLDYTQPIDPVSSWQASLGYFETDELGGNKDSRTTASLAYSRSLTPEWRFNTGYDYTLDDSGSDSNAVFFNVTRDITFGF
jgi:hypothetical protein